MPSGPETATARKSRQPVRHRKARDDDYPPISNELMDYYMGFTDVAGELTRPPANGQYRVQYRRIHRSKTEYIMTRLIVMAVVGLDLRFVYWLLHDAQYPSLVGAWWLDATKVVMVGGSIIMQLFLLLNVITVGHACMAARDPIPVTPPKGLRVAFLTTIVPNKEPIGMARRTLEYARRIRYDHGPEGCFDTWLLDEGNLDEIKRMCDSIGVKHYSRKEDEGGLVLREGTFADKSKHGNHNRWLWKFAKDYDIIMCVDTDHVPMPNMAERMLGYFRDPNVAFVVGPQFYGNAHRLVARWAESAQYLFHSIIQRAGNRHRCAMLVGTSVAVRVSALADLGGYIGSITEDLATSIHLHGRKNPITGKRWLSVYTPDLTAIGEGPASFTEFFQQQDRWSGGTFDAVLWGFHYLKNFFKLRPAVWLHYTLMLTYYPSVAVGWIMGVVVSGCYLGLGIAGLESNASWWVTYFVDIAVLQFVLYWFMRRHNVSPHEPQGSSGFTGMMLSALTSPIYARSLFNVFIGRGNKKFNTTQKGDGANPDNILTFRYHLVWAVVIIAILASAVLHDRFYWMMIAWAILILNICLSPIIIMLRDRKNWREQPLSQDQPDQMYELVGKEVG